LSARFCVVQQNSFNSGTQFIRENQESLGWLKHYRPYGFNSTRQATKCPRTWARNYIFSIGLSTAVGFGAAGIPSRCLSQPARAPSDLAHADALRGALWKLQAPAGDLGDELSDDDIMVLTNDRLKRDALESVQQQYGDLNHLNGDVFGQLGAMAPATARPILACSLNAPQDKQACLNHVKSELSAERDNKIKAIQATNMISLFVIAIQQKAKYEGNYVVILALRERGTDKAWQWKMLLKPKDGSWFVADKKETPMN
jgi:hypothetical protein